MSSGPAEREGGPADTGLPEEEVTGSGQGVCVCRVWCGGEVR